jgi:hypothetical protein
MCKDLYDGEKVKKILTLALHLNKASATNILAGVHGLMSRSIQ